MASASDIVYKKWKKQIMENKSKKQGKTVYENVSESIVEQQWKMVHHNEVFKEEKCDTVHNQQWRKDLAREYLRIHCGAAVQDGPPQGIVLRCSIQPENKFIFSCKQLKMLNIDGVV